MPIHIASEIVNPRPWIRALKDADPSIEVKTIDDIDKRSEVEFVLAWNYPHGLFRNYPRLKTISSMGAGVDHLLDDPMLPVNINVVRLIDPKLSQDMYEFTLALIMNRLRMLTLYREYQDRKIWKKHLYLRISDVRVGIMGTGVIGGHVAGQLHAAGFLVSGWKKAPGKPVQYKMYYGNDHLREFLSSSGILVNLLPLTSETRDILNRKTLSILPEGAWLINLGRGGHLVDNDLVNALDTGHLEGANLDVFRNEPLPPDHPFWDHPKIYLTPHIASLPTPASVAPQIIENYRRTLDNRPLLNIVDRERGY